MKAATDVLVDQVSTSTFQSGLPAPIKPIAVLDIGSNSVRMVIYEHHARALTPLFNEKATCMLGRGVSKTGLIDKNNAALALAAIKRFAFVIGHLLVGEVFVFATSAVREAENGKQFMAEVDALMGVPGQVLSGVEEARFAALGVVSGMPDFSGVVGDLGGGSLELSHVPPDIKTGETLELGAIRLQDDSDLSPANALTIANKRLKKSQVLKRNVSDQFCAIGGTWRALAILMQIRSDYPIRLVQNFSVGAKEVLNLSNLLIENTSQVPELDQIGRSRAALVPYGAAVLSAIIRKGKFSDVVFSALGVREGYLFDRLKKSDARVHPLMQAAKEMSQQRSRSPQHDVDLIGFTARFLHEMGENETKRQKQLREATCLLSDLGWRGHKDYRASQSVDLIAYSALTGVDHPGRAFMAEALGVRYGGIKQNTLIRGISGLMSHADLLRARLIGGILRVAFALSGATPGLLPSIGLICETKELCLRLPSHLANLDSERLRTRLNQLAIFIGKGIEVVRVPAKSQSR